MSNDHNQTAIISALHALVVARTQGGEDTFNKDNQTYFAAVRRILENAGMNVDAAVEVASAGGEVDITEVADCAVALAGTAERAGIFVQQQA